MKKYFIAIGAVIGMVLMFLLKLLEGPKIKTKTINKTVDRSKNVDRSKTKNKKTKQEGKITTFESLEDMKSNRNGTLIEPKKKKKFRLFGKKRKK